ncbi:extracellular solute-binding protein [Poseidonocella sp. HB161398]|uniref:extracellular solute-binding protein n=1 Tax=Poseidonocella sp. HB161398 TaxID=2320855 RepID=UPI00197CF7CD|nr:extracellular solute-binding protein [Poseidonocella sp. HB161398]
MLKTSALSALAMLAGSAALQAADIEFWYGNTGTGEVAIQAACDAFNAAQDDHAVACMGQGSYETGMQKAIAAYRSGRHPALIQFFDAGTLDLMLSGAVLPVEELEPEVDWGDYINGARSYYETSEGMLYSQPYNGSTLIFYGNRELLEKAGIEALPATWEELADAARRLREAGVDCPFVTDAHPWRVLEQFSARHGLPIASRDNGYGGLDAEYTFNTGKVAEHLQNLHDWREEGLVKLNEDTAAGNYTVAFNTGECAMMEGSTGSYGAAFAALGDKVEIAMAPMYQGYERHNTLIGGASVWVMKGHDEASYEAARAFLDFLRGDDRQIAFTRTTGYMPVTKSALAALEAEGLAAEPDFATVPTGVGSLDQPGGEGSRGVRLGFYVQFRDIFMEETQKAFTGGQSMQAALDTAKERGDALLRRFEDTYKGVALP